MSRRVPHCIVDVTDPSAPKVTSTFRLPERIWAFTVLESIAYVAGDWLGLGILDISNPAAPRLRGTFKTVGQAPVVAVANQMSGIDVVDLSDPDDPIQVSSYFTEGYARNVATAGSFAYVVDMPTGFSILDVSKEGPPMEMSTQQSAEAPLIVEVSQPSRSDWPQIACVLTGRILDITAGTRGGGLQLYDVSDRSAPVKVRTYRTPGQAMRAGVQGSLAYVADGLSDPHNPTISESYQTVGPAHDVAVAGPLVFVVVDATSDSADLRKGSSGVVILRRNP
jgi:hypothetical protein